MADFLHAALAYIEIGWSVFPLAPASKVPAISGGRGVKDATRDVDQIRRWSIDHPNANIGIACGEVSGIVVIDVDPRNGANASMAALAEKGRSFPPCPVAKTGGGGVHLIFRYDEKVANSKDKLGRGIDVKSSGGYIVAAPSVVRQKDGTRGEYKWLTAPFDQPAPRLPIWVRSMLVPPPRPQYQPTASVPRDGASIRGLTEFLARAPSGERNNRLYWCAKRVADMVHANRISEGSAVSQLLAIAMQIGLPHKEAAMTIRSAFNLQSTVRE